MKVSSLLLSSLVFGPVYADLQRRQTLGSGFEGDLNQAYPVKRDEGLPIEDALDIALSRRTNESPARAFTPSLPNPPWIQESKSGTFSLFSDNHPIHQKVKDNHASKELGQPVSSGASQAQYRTKSEQQHQRSQTQSHGTNQGSPSNGNSMQSRPSFPDSVGSNSPGSHSSSPPGLHQAMGHPPAPQSSMQSPSLRATAPSYIPQRGYRPPPPPPPLQRPPFNYPHGHQMMFFPQPQFLLGPPIRPQIRQSLIPPFSRSFPVSHNPRVGNHGTKSRPRKY